MQMDGVCIYVSSSLQQYFFKNKSLTISYLIVCMMRKTSGVLPSFFSISRSVSIAYHNGQRLKIKIKWQ